MNDHASLLELQRAQLRLTLDPLRGGAVRAFDCGEGHIFRSTPAPAGDDPFDMACFPMVPYVNRITCGRFSFGGHAVRLKRNWSVDPHPLHGYGWRAPWSVLAASSSSATLRLEGGADEWPWRYGSEQCFELLPDGLSIELSITNLGREPMPVMLGLHPYFPDAQHAQLQAHLPQVWMTDRASLPVEQVSTPAEWGFEPPRAIDEVPLDHCYSGWNGIAMLRWPDRTITLRASHCDHLHVYAPAGKDFFCIEPQSAPPGTLTRAGANVTVVAPGERYAIRVLFLIGTN